MNEYRYLVCVTIYFSLFSRLASSYINNMTWYEAYNSSDCNLPEHELQYRNLTFVSHSNRAVWFGMHVLYTPWLNFTGCYRIHIDSLEMQNISWTTDPVFQCFQRCKSTFFLTTKKCFCKKNSTPGPIQQSGCLGFNCGGGEGFCGNDRYETDKISCACKYELYGGIKPSQRHQNRIIGNCMTVSNSSLRQVTCSSNYNFSCVDISNNEVISSSKLLQWHEAGSSCFDRYNKQFSSNSKRAFNNFWTTIFRGYSIRRGLPTQTPEHCVASRSLGFVVTPCRDRLSCFAKNTSTTKGPCISQSTTQRIRIDGTYVTSQTRMTDGPHNSRTVQKSTAMPQVPTTLPLIPDIPKTSSMMPTYSNTTLMSKTPTLGVTNNNGLSTTTTLVNFQQEVTLSTNKRTTDEYIYVAIGVASSVIVLALVILCIILVNRKRKHSRSDNGKDLEEPNLHRQEHVDISVHSNPNNRNDTDEVYNELHERRNNAITNEVYSRTYQPSNRDGDYDALPSRSIRENRSQDVNDTYDHVPKNLRPDGIYNILPSNSVNTQGTSDYDTMSDIMNEVV